MRNPTLPPPHVMAALRVPRADQVWALCVWKRAAADPWRRNTLLTPFEIAALRRRGKARSEFYRKAFAHLEPISEARKP
jgi:hypothetical protein